MIADKPPAPFVAAHRFGLGEPRLDALAYDPRGWLQSQIGPADAQLGTGLADATVALQRVAQFQALRAQRERPASPAMAASAAMVSDEQTFAEHYRSIVQADVRARLLTAASTTRPFAERLAIFWSNHFTVSMAKASARGLVGCFEREAIRPHIAGRFETLLGAAVRHPAMLRYLDNDQSAGPASRIVSRLAARARIEGGPPPRPAGLNENLARELLELHTLGASGGGAAYGGWGGYTQTDVTELARVLTGWRIPLRSFVGNTVTPGTPVSIFDTTWHQPGPKRVIGLRLEEGPQALDAIVQALARHPSTARFIGYKLARHFVADQPPPTLVARLAERFERTEGQLSEVYRALIESPEAWSAPSGKLKSPEEFVIGSVRLLGTAETAFARAPDGGLAQLGQRLQAAPSPAGWPDQADEWLGPESLWKRVEWASRVGDRLGRGIDARALARSSLGDALTAATRGHLERAADGPQALTLLLLSPELQRR